MNMIKGQLTNPQTKRFAGYTVQGFFTDKQGDIRAVQAVCESDGQFELPLSPQLTDKATLALQALAPGGLVVGSYSLNAKSWKEPLSLPVTQAVPVRVQSGNLPLAGRLHITGRALNPDGQGVPVGTAVFLGVSAQAPADAAQPATTLNIVGTVSTLADGYFSLDVPQLPLANTNTRAYAVIADQPAVPVPLEGGQWPQRLVLMAQEPVTQGTPSLSGVPRALNHDDFTSDSTLFNEDRGGRCMTLTTPNRALEEVPFYAVVRTSQPAIRGVVVSDSASAGDNKHHEALQASLKALDDLTEKDIEKEYKTLLSVQPNVHLGVQPGVQPMLLRSNVSTTGSNNLPSNAPAGLNAAASFSASDVAHLNLLGNGVTPFMPVNDTIKPLAAAKFTDGRVLGKVLQGIRGDKGWAEVGTQALDAAAKEMSRLLRAAQSQGAQRVELDADTSIDWDDTPTLYQATEVAHGHLLTYKQVWRADGYSLGDLLYSLPLAPGQKKYISTLDWDRQETAIRLADRNATEDFAAGLQRDRDISETINTALQESMHASANAHTEAFGGGLGVFIGPIVIGGGGGYANAGADAHQYSARDVAAQSLQSIRDRTVQAASMVRSQRITVVQSARQGESLRAQTDVVANYNHCHAMTVEYFEVLRHFRVDVELAQVQECLFIPLDIGDFDGAKALRWKQELRTYLPRALKPTLDALERQQTQWVHADVPANRYADETLRWFDGELQIRFDFPFPLDHEDGTYDSASWAPYATLLQPRQTEALWRSYIATVPAAQRAATWQQRVAPIIARALSSRLKVQLLNAQQGVIQSIPIDPTMVGTYRPDAAVLVSLRPSSVTPLSVTRDQVRYVRLSLDPQFNGSNWTLPDSARIQVQSATLRYRTDHLNHHFVNSRRVDNDINLFDDVLIATPLDKTERRNPKDEDRKAANRLLTHLNEHVERYHRGIWLSMHPNRRYLLIDGLICPHAQGRSVASVVENRLIGIVGNCLVMPVAPGVQLDPSYVLTEGAALRDRYAGHSVPPFRISVPTKGVFAEAILGDCNACEPKDDSRFWRWEEAKIPDNPPAIGDMDLSSRRGTPPTLTADSFDTPIVKLQDAPGAPNATALGSALSLIGTPNLFKDMTGVTLNTENAAKAFNAALDTAQFFGEQAATIAKQRYLNQEMDRNVNRIQKAQQSGLISEAQAQELTENLFRGATGQPQRPASAPTTPSEHPAVQSLIQRAAQSENGRVAIRNAAGRVEINNGVQVGGDAYSISPTITPIAQPTNMVCWAACGTMLLSWKDRQAYDIPTAMQHVGPIWQQRFSANEGLTLAQMQAFNTAVGLSGEAPMCYEPRAILRMLQAHGPLLVIGDDGVDNNLVTHALIVTGITGASSVDNCMVTLVDPATGTRRDLSYMDFSGSMEATDPVTLGMGIYHF